MARTKRKIIEIDEEKCNGCGLCVPSCEEGAIQIINGKAKLVSDSHCDGLGACLGECPLGALKIIERDADEFDESLIPKAAAPAPLAPMPCGCPGTMAKSFVPKHSSTAAAGRQNSELRQWPIQLALISPAAPYLKNADIIFMADCCAVAYANLHSDILRGRAIAIACPKLDDADSHFKKLVQMIKQNAFRSIEVIIMEVPCCRGLMELVKNAVSEVGTDIPVKETIIGIEGEVQS